MRINIDEQNKIVRKIVVVIIVVVLSFSSISSVFADLSVGVRKDDWIEYAVTYTGSPTQGHDINWARIDITSVQGTIISVSINSRYPNGSTEIFNSTLNLQTGKLIDDFIIPANLKTNDTFLDQNLGNIKINRVDQQKYAGAIRTVLYASTNQNTYVWDQATGVSLEATSKQPDYSMHTIIVGTNLWQPSEDLESFFLVIIAFSTLITLVVIMILKYRQKKDHKNE
jgi:hypothetical protein